MLVEQIDNIGLEPFQRSVRDFSDVVRPAIQPREPFNVETEFRGDYHLASERSESFADEFFILERAVRLSRVEEGDPFFEGRADQGDAVLFVYGWAVAKAQSHAAEADG